MQAKPIPDDPREAVAVFSKMKQESINSLPRQSLGFRKLQLEYLHRGLKQLQAQFSAALASDLGQSAFFNQLSSMTPVLKEIEHMVKHMYEYAEPRKVDTPLFIGGKSHVRPQPFGLTLVIGAWNYPLVTSLGPAVNAMAAGNSVLLKPSQMSPCSSNVLKKLFDKYLDPRFYRVVEGQVEVSKAIIELPFDQIIFTGSPQKGKMVAQAAAKNLVPCILQLGGKSPVIVDEDADLQNAALRVVFGRYMNCGQTCIAPDYVLVNQKVMARFSVLLAQKVRAFFGEDSSKSPDIGRIVNDFHTGRLKGMLTESHGGKVLVGGRTFDKERFVEPTIVANPRPDSQMMQEEIFGPILPLLQVKSIEQSIAFINAREKPLALYYFGQRSCQKVQAQTSSGSFVSNDCIFQMLNLDLPFGGVGNSGHGFVHGKLGFDRCSHMKAVLNARTMNGGLFAMRYPPFTQSNQRTLIKMINWLDLGQEALIRKALIFLAIILAFTIYSNFF